MKTSKNILVLDDDADILKAFKMVLEKQGFKVNAFSNPYLALDYFQKHPRDCSLVISDIRMPKMTGIEFAEKIRDINSDIKIVLMTAYDIENEIKNKLQELSSDSSNTGSVIQKPIPLEDLILYVEKALDMKKKSI